MMAKRGRLVLEDTTVGSSHYRHLQILSIRYHSEGFLGPLDNVYLFDTFLEMASGRQNWVTSQTSCKNRYGVRYLWQK